MWIKTEEIENNEMIASQWPRAIKVVEDVGTGQHSYHFTYTPPTRPRDHMITVKRNSSNGSSYTAPRPALKPSIARGDNKAGHGASRRRRGGRKHHAGRQSKPCILLGKHLPVAGQHSEKVQDHRGPCCNPSSGKYGAQHHVATCFRSQARPLRRTYTSVPQQYRPRLVTIPKQTSRTPRRRAADANAGNPNIIPIQNWPRWGGSRHALSGHEPQKRYPTKVVSKHCVRSTGPATPILEIRGLAARSIARQFWCPTDRTLQVYLVAILKRWCRMMTRSLETGEQQFDTSELGLRQLWGLVCEKQVGLVRKEKC